MLNLIHKICNLLFECNFNDLSINSYKPVLTYVNGVYISYVCSSTYITCNCVYISVIRCQYLSNNNNNNQVDEKKKERKNMNTNSPVSLV